MNKIKIGKIPVYKGEYDSSKIYDYLNLVIYEGSTYLSLIDNNSSIPTEGSWTIIAKGLNNIQTSKIENIEEGALKNVLSDWKQTDENADDFIKNKPNLADVPNDDKYYARRNKTWEEIPKPINHFLVVNGKLCLVYKNNNNNNNNI